MKDILQPVRDKLNDIIINLIINGIILLLLAVFIVWTEFLLEILVGLFILVVAYIFFYAAYKLRMIRKMLG